MSALFKSKTQEEIALVFDIGNGSIAATIVKFTDHGIPIALYSHREPLTFLPEADSKHLLKNMLKLMGGLVERVQKEGLPKVHTTLFSPHAIKKIFCFYSSPWFISHTKLLSVEKPKPFLINQSAIDEMVAEEQKQFLATVENGYYEKLFGTDIRLLEKNIIHIKLNGYEVRNPIGKKASQVEVTFYLSFISDQIVKEVENILHKAFSFRTIEHHSCSLGAWSAVRAMFPNATDFLTLDISGETTDVSLTCRGVLTETISFPTGRSSVIRHLVKELAVPPEVALSFLIMHTAGAVEEKFAKKLASDTQVAVAEWQKGFLDAIKELQKRYLIPKQMFLSTEMDLSSLFVKALQLPVPMELGVSNNSFEILFLGPERVKSFIQNEAGVRIDPVLSLESIFLNNVIIK